MPSPSAERAVSPWRRVRNLATKIDGDAARQAGEENLNAASKDARRSPKLRPAPARCSGQAPGTIGKVGQRRRTPSWKAGADEHCSEPRLFESGDTASLAPCISVDVKDVVDRFEHGLRPASLSELSRLYLNVEPSGLPDRSHFAKINMAEKQRRIHRDDGFFVILAMCRLQLQLYSLYSLLVYSRAHRSQQTNFSRCEPGTGFCGW